MAWLTLRIWWKTSHIVQHRYIYIQHILVMWEHESSSTLYGSFCHSSFVVFIYLVVFVFVYMCMYICLTGLMWPSCNPKACLSSWAEHGWIWSTLQHAIPTLYTTYTVCWYTYRPIYILFYTVYTDDELYTVTVYRVNNMSGTHPWKSKQVDGSSPINLPSFSTPSIFIASVLTAAQRYSSGCHDAAVSISMTKQALKSP